MLTSTGRAHARKLALRALIPSKREHLSHLATCGRRAYWGQSRKDSEEPESTFGLRKPDTHDPAPPFARANWSDGSPVTPAKQYIEEGLKRSGRHDGGARIGVAADARSAQDEVLLSWPKPASGAGFEEDGSSSTTPMFGRIRGQQVSYTSRPVPSSFANTTSRPLTKPTSSTGMKNDPQVSAEEYSLYPSSLGTAPSESYPELSHQSLRFRPPTSTAIRDGSPLSQGHEDKTIRSTLPSHTRDVTSSSADWTERPEPYEPNAESEFGLSREKLHRLDSIRRDRRPTPSATLFVGNLAPETTAGEITRALVALGAAPKDVRIALRSPRTHAFYAHADFRTIDDARRVYDAAASAVAEGTTPYVEIAGRDARIEFGGAPKDRSRQPLSTTIFLGGFKDLGLTRSRIADLVRDRLSPNLYGKGSPIRAIRIFTDQAIAYIDFRAVESAQALIASHDAEPLTFNGRVLRADFSAPTQKHLEKSTVATSRVPTRFVYIGNLPMYASGDSLRAEIQAALVELGGRTPLDVTLPRDNSGHYLGYGHAHYATVEDAEELFAAARARFSGQQHLLLQGGRCFLDFASAEPTPERDFQLRPPSRTLFIGYLADSGITPADIEHRLNEIIGRAAVLDVRMTGDGAIAHVDMETLPDARKVIAHTPLSICGRVVKLDFGREVLRIRNAAAAERDAAHMDDTLFIGNLGCATEVDVRSALAQLGPSDVVVSVFFPPALDTITDAHVELESLADVERVMLAQAEAPLTTTSGTTLMLEFVRKPGTTPTRLPAPHLTVHHVGVVDDENAVRAALDRAAGRPATLRVNLTRLSTYPFAHVRYRDATEAGRALAAHNARPLTMEGRPLRVKYARRRERAPKASAAAPQRDSSADRAGVGSPSGLNLHSSGSNITPVSVSVHA